MDEQFLYGYYNKYIEQYLKVNGRIPKDTAKKYSRAVYDVYKMLVRQGYETADFIKNRKGFDVTTAEIAKQTGIDISFVQLYFRALSAAIQQGVSKPQDLYISTALAVKEQKTKDLKDAIGFNIMGDIGTKILGFGSLGLAVFLIYKFQGGKYASKKKA